MAVSTVARPWTMAVSTVARPCSITVSTVARPCSIAVPIVLRPRSITFLTLPATRRLLLCPAARDRLDHDLHGTWLRIGCNLDGLHCLLQRKAMRDELGQIKAIAIARENQVGHLVQNGERRRV